MHEDHEFIQYMPPTQGQPARFTVRAETPDLYYDNRFIRCNNHRLPSQEYICEKTGCGHASNLHKFSGCLAVSCSCGFFALAPRD